MDRRLTSLPAIAAIGMCILAAATSAPAQPGPPAGARLNCALITTTANPPVRAEGTTDLIGDIVIACRYT